MAPRSSATGPQDYKAAVKAAVRDERTFLRLTLSGQVSSSPPPWTKVSVRPVLIRRRRQWQFSYFDATRNVVANFPRSQLDAPLEEVLAMPFAHMEVQSAKRRPSHPPHPQGQGAPDPREAPPPGCASGSCPQPPQGLPAGADRARGLPAGPGHRRPPRAGPADDARQVRPGERVPPRHRPDGGRPCPGRPADVSGGLRLRKLAPDLRGLYFLRDVRGLDVRVAGIDVKADLVRQCQALRDELGWQELEFSACRDSRLPAARARGRGAEPARLRHGHRRGDRPRRPVGQPA